MHKMSKPGLTKEDYQGLIAGIAQLQHTDLTADSLINKDEEVSFRRSDSLNSLEDNSAQENNSDATQESEEVKITNLPTRATEQPVHSALRRVSGSNSSESLRRLSRDNHELVSRTDSLSSVSSEVAFNLANPTLGAKRKTPIKCAMQKSCPPVVPFEDKVMKNTPLPCASSQIPDTPTQKNPLKRNRKSSRSRSVGSIGALIQATHNISSETIKGIQKEVTQRLESVEQNSSEQSDVVFSQDTLQACAKPKIWNFIKTSSDKQDPDQPHSTNNESCRKAEPKCPVSENAPKSHNESDSPDDNKEELWDFLQNSSEPLINNSNVAIENSNDVHIGHKYEFEHIENLTLKKNVYEIKVELKNCKVS